MSKMGLHDPFVHFKHNYGQKKGRESKFDFWPLKVKNHPDLLVCKWCARYHWKAFDKGYNFALDLISIRGLHAKLRALKIARVPIMGISGLPFGSLGTKWHLGVSLVTKHKIYYKGEGGGFPPNLGYGEYCESVFACGSFVHQNVPTMH
jgi:hypothetical protein